MRRILDKNSCYGNVRGEVRKSERGFGYYSISLNISMVVIACYVCPLASFVGFSNAHCWIGSSPIYIYSVLPVFGLSE